MKMFLAAAVVALGAAPAMANDCKVTKESYDRLASGMSYEEAVAVLGCEGEEMSSSEFAGMVTVMLMWEGDSFGGNMNAMFQNDELVSKAQFGLR